MKTRYTILTLLAMTFAACTNENDAERDFTSVPLQITAQIGNEAATRVTGTSFDDGDAIGIKTETADEPYTYHATTNSWSGNYNFESNKVTLRAYYPYNQVTSEAKDYLFAVNKDQEVTNDPVTFNFHHVMSKICFTFTQGADVSDTELATINKVTISGLYAEGTFNTLATAVADAASAPASAGQATKDITAGSDNTAIIFPQTGRFSVSLTMNGVTYYTTEEIDQTTFVSGKVYTYNITVSKTAMTIQYASINDWSAQASLGNSEESEEPTDKYTYGSIPYVGYTKDGVEQTVNQYALAFSDGSFENISKTGTEIDDLKQFELEHVVGVVFYIGEKASTDDAALANDYPHCTHGLICALYNAKTIDAYRYDSKLVRMHWQTIGKEESISEWFKTCTMDHKSLYSYTDITSSGNIKKIMGYNNTQVLKAYNATCTEDRADYLIRPIHALGIYENPSPEGASSWFMPSAYELNLIYKDSNIETILNKLSGILETNTEVTRRSIPFRPSGGSTYTWSSTEKNSDVVWSVDFKSSGLTESHKNKSSEKEKDKDGKETGNYLENAFNVRPICAF